MAGIIVAAVLVEPPPGREMRAAGGNDHCAATLITDPCGAVHHSRHSSFREGDPCLQLWTAWSKRRRPPRQFGCQKMHSPHVDPIPLTVSTQLFHNCTMVV